MINIDSLLIKSDAKVLVDIDNLPIRRATALVGQSGSGKSLTLKAILDMLPSNLQKSISMDAPFVLEKGSSVSFIPQNPFTALSPLTKISKQFFASEEKAKELFNMLDLEWRLFNEFPPNLSGGQLQRVIFAIALANEPKLLLLDEPTTALDVKLREEVVQILKKLQEKLNFYMLFVTHEINLASKLCDYMVVLKDGKVVESGLAEEINKAPKEAYTKLLIESNFANREFRVWLTKLLKHF